MPETATTKTRITKAHAAQVTNLKHLAYGNWVEIETRLNAEIQELLGEMPTLRSAHSRQLCHLRIVACSEAIRDGHYDQL